MISLFRQWNSSICGGQKSNLPGIELLALTESDTFLISIINNKEFIFFSSVRRIKYSLRIDELYAAAFCCNEHHHLTDVSGHLATIRKCIRAMTTQLCGTSDRISLSLMRPEINVGVKNVTRWWVAEAKKSSSSLPAQQRSDQLTWSCLAFCLPRNSWAELTGSLRLAKHKTQETRSTSRRARQLWLTGMTSTGSDFTSPRFTSCVQLFIFYVIMLASRLPSTSALARSFLLKPVCTCWEQWSAVCGRWAGKSGRKDRGQEGHTPLQILASKPLLKGEVCSLLYPEDKKVPHCCLIHFHQSGKFQLSGFVIEENQSFVLLSFEKSLVCYFSDSFYVTISNICMFDLVWARLAENDPVFGSSKLLRHPHRRKWESTESIWRTFLLTSRASGIPAHFLCPDLLQLLLNLIWQHVHVWQPPSSLSSRLSLTETSALFASSSIRHFYVFICFCPQEEGVGALFALPGGPSHTSPPFWIGASESSKVEFCWLNWSFDTLEQNLCIFVSASLSSTSTIWLKVHMLLLLNHNDIKCSSAGGHQAKFAE